MAFTSLDLRYLMTDTQGRPLHIHVTKFRCLFSSLGINLGDKTEQM